MEDEEGTFLLSLNPPGDHAPGPSPPPEPALTKTGVLGKSALLRQLLNTIEENRRQSLYSSPDFSVVGCTVAADAL